MSFIKKIVDAKNISFLCLFLLSSPLTGTAEAQTFYKLIDFGDKGYSETSKNWETYVYPDSPGGSYRYLSRLLGDHTRTGTATWTITIPYCGLYEVKVSCRKTENRTNNADYYVTNSKGGEDKFEINQVNHHNVLDWDTLGRYYYAKDQIVRVHLDGTDDGASDCADAASWELITPVSCFSSLISTYSGQVPIVPQTQLLLKIPTRK